MDENVVMF